MLRRAIAWAVDLPSVYQMIRGPDRCGCAEWSYSGVCENFVCTNLGWNCSNGMYRVTRIQPSCRQEVTSPGGPNYRRRGGSWRKKASVTPLSRQLPPPLKTYKIRQKIERKQQNGQVLIPLCFFLDPLADIGYSFALLRFTSLNLVKIRKTLLDAVFFPTLSCESCHFFLRLLEVRLQEAFADLFF